MIVMFHNLNYYNHGYQPILSIRLIAESLKAQTSDTSLDRSDELLGVRHHAWVCENQTNFLFRIASVIAGSSSDSRSGWFLPSFAVHYQLQSLIRINPIRLINNFQLSQVIGNNGSFRLVERTAFYDKTTIAPAAARRSSRLHRLLVI